MYSTDKVYLSTLYFLSTIMPAGVVIAEGESYGVRLDDPAGKSPSVTVTLPEFDDAGLELGSVGTSYSTIFTINAKSYRQRNALKDTIASGLRFKLLPIYSNFGSGYIPASGAVIENYAELGSYFKARDMPNFDSDNEKFFWNAVVFVTLNVLGS